jgi:tetrapyrrole methylase family protein/MazG family protein
LCGGDVVVLLEAGEFGAIVAREAQGAVGEDSLGVDEVAHYLADAPFSGGVALQRVRFGEAAKFRHGAFDLAGERSQNVAVGNEVHVAAEVGCVLRGVGLGYKKVRHTRYVTLREIASPNRMNQETAGEKFQQLVAIMARLRGPGGCPWDRQQTFDSIKPFTLEETYEVLDAIDHRDWGELAQELGDFMLQAVFYAQMASEQQLFRIEDALDAINQKLVRRHPHVFGEESAGSADEVLSIWGRVKDAEPKAERKKATGLLGGVPRALPALVEAQQIASKAAGVGFDWENAEQVLDKLQEELAEFAQARRNAAQDELEDELGDMLFVLVNLARFVKVDPEQALRRTNAKFRTRWSHIEARLSEQGRKPEDATIDEMEALWQEAKSK